MNTRSISFRLVAWYAGGLALIFALLCSLLYLDLRRFLENDVHRAEARRTQQIATMLLAHVPETGEGHAISQIKDWFDPEINGRFIRLTRYDGSIAYVSGAPKDGSFDPAGVPAIEPSSKTEFSRKVKLANGRTLLIAVLKYKSPGKPSYQLEFGALLDPTEAMLNHLILQLVWGLPVAIIIIAAGGYLLVQRALKPVEEITRAAESITQHNLSDRLPIAQSGDELERLSLSLNRMITRLDDAFKNSRRLVADASHELRTPLTVLRGELEALTEEDQVETYVRERAASLLEEVAHLTKIVEGLLMLSRLDAGEAQVEWSQFDLAELARTTADQMSLLADDKNISITCNANQPVPVEGDRVRLKRVVVNLLDNAIKYTPEKGAIELNVHAANGHVLLEVKDNGIGIPEAALPHIFERFYCVDPSRSESESTGLGLSIVKAICAAHGAEVEAESTLGKGSRFRVILSAPDLLSNNSSQRS